MTKLSLMLIYLTRSTLCKFFTPLRGNGQRIGFVDLISSPNFTFYSLFSFQNEENFILSTPFPKSTQPIHQSFGLGMTKICPLA